jgi:peptidoglycan-associated lipoprotein
MIRRSGTLFAISTLMIALIGCASPLNPPPPKWSVENPNAASGSGEKPAQTARETKRDTSGTSSLDALRNGQSTASSGALKDVYFAFDRAELSDEARAALKADSEWLNANASVRVQIEGHCDERGAEDYNMALGAKRAQVAMEYLTSLGITPGRMSTISFGEEVPVCRDHSEECWTKNRRARFVVVSGQPTS